MGKHIVCNRPLADRQSQESTHLILLNVCLISCKEKLVDKLS